MGGGWGHGEEGPRPWALEQLPWALHSPHCGTQPQSPGVKGHLPGEWTSCENSTQDTGPELLTQGREKVVVPVGKPRRGWPSVLADSAGRRFRPRRTGPQSAGGEQGLGSALPNTRSLGSVQRRGRENLLWPRPVPPALPAYHEGARDRCAACDRGSSQNCPRPKTAAVQELLRASRNAGHSSCCALPCPGTGPLFAAT